MSLDDIETAVAGIDWDDMLDDGPPRRDLPFRRKRDDLSYLVKYRPGYRRGHVRVPMGLVDGQKVVQFFRRHLGRHAESGSFDRLPVTLRVVATDLVTGDAVVLNSGDLVVAVRASMSIPVFFSPVDWGGRRLIDGGPANNLYPRRGFGAYAAGFWSRRSLGASRSFEQLAAGFNVAATRGNYSVLLGAEAGTTRDDDAPLQSQFLLGGLGRLSGYPDNRFVGQHCGLTTVTAYRRLRESPWLPAYLGMSLEAGNVWRESNRFGRGEWLRRGRCTRASIHPWGRCTAR